MCRFLGDEARRQVPRVFSGTTPTLEPVLAAQFQKRLHPVQCFVQCPLKGAAAWSETEVLTTLVFERGLDGNVYLDGRVVTITLLE
jgi:hypothetical protein